MNAVSSQEIYLFVGTYTSGKSEGIYVYKFNTTNGELKEVSKMNSSNPSFLAFSPAGNLYAVNENSGEKGGEISAYSFDKQTGELKFINKEFTSGDHPCYVAVDKNNSWVAVGNYSGGNISMFPLESNGALKPASQIVHHKGKSINTERQGKAHVHATVFSPDNKTLWVPDLGMDALLVYDFDGSKAEPLMPADVGFKVAPGNGPRHIAFHPAGKYVFLMEELSGTVAVYRIEDNVMVQRISSHPKDFKGVIGSADIHISPDGKFLYASNRGDANDIAIFSINTSTGELTSTGFKPSGGIKPRNFMIDPTGNFLLVANQESSNIVVFKRDPITGLLSTVRTVEVPNPVCLITE